MLVSHRKKFIYTKTAKTAGTSVESYFEQYCMPEGEWTPEHNREVHVSDAGIIGFRGANRPKETEWFNHMPAKRIKAQVGDEIWNSYFKFCVVRDPFDKAVSAFYHFYKSRESAGVKPEYKSLKQRVLGFFKKEAKFDTIQEEFEHWLKSGGMVVDRDKYTIDGEFCVDEVIRYENLQGDMEKVCLRIGVDWDPDRLPEFKKGIRDDKVGLSEIYTAKSAKIISDLYAYELDRFGYKAPI
ncbi:MAG: sulfotransferase family 2 domain-containing protein [Verrucomicrobiae bacterium]|nr:sulfotransferase family 2 domain-containing protein [Verrucomicrobiae bacterium]